MLIERHATLAAPDAYAAGGGYLSKRSAKIITYHKNFGEVGRLTLRPEMVQGAARMPVVANDNVASERRVPALATEPVKLVPFEQVHDPGRYRHFVQVRWTRFHRSKYVSHGLDFLSVGS